MHSFMSFMLTQDSYNCLLTADAESVIALEYTFCTVKRMYDGFMSDGKEAEVLRGGGSVRCLAGRPDHRANWVMTRIG